MNTTLGLELPLPLPFPCPPARFIPPLAPLLPFNFLVRFLPRLSFAAAAQPTAAAMRISEYNRIFDQIMHCSHLKDCISFKKSRDRCKITLMRWLFCLIIGCRGQDEGCRMRVKDRKKIICRKQRCRMLVTLCRYASVQYILYELVDI